jgi:dTDP-4-dehydrorhamnose reductase
VKQPGFAAVATAAIPGYCFGSSKSGFAMKCLVLGANGQLGRDLLRLLPVPVIGVGRDRADLTSPESLRRVLDEERPDTVINCAAYNFVDRAESEPMQAFAVNSIGVRELAKLCGLRDIRLVHLSTDYVFGFDVARRQPYSESDLPGPINVYGTSKLAGEEFVACHCPRHLIIRTCGLYGVETMLRLAEAGQTIRVVTDEICAPTYTADLAQAIVALISSDASGLLHLTSSGFCSRFEFAAEIFRQAGLSPTLVPVTSAEFGAAARRPVYAVLSNTRYISLGFDPLPTWQDALSRYLEERRKKRAV